MRSPAFVLIALAPLLFGFKPFERRNSEVEQGNAALQAGKAEDALAHYDKAVAKLPGEAGVHLDRGTALYALSRFDEARQEFLNATQGQDQAVKATAFRNLGNALSKLEKHKDAVEAYKHALALQPDDKAAKWNLEIALRKQKEEEKKKQDDKDKNKDDKKDDKDKDKDKDKTGRQGQEQGRQEGQGQGQEGPARQAGEERPEGQGQAGEAAAARESGTESARAHPGDAEEPRGESEGSGKGAGPPARGTPRAAGAGLVMPASAKRPLASLALATVAALASTAAQAGAGASSFSASIDRAAVAPDQPFLYRVTLTTSDGQPEGFKPPDFRGLRVVGGPFTQTGMSMQVGSGGTRVENSVTWSYQLTVPQGTKGQVAIGAAHVRVGGQDLSSNAVQVRIGAPAAAPPPAQRPQRGPNLFPRGMFGDDEPQEQEPVASSATGAFLRAVADKKRAFVGEQVTVTWYLYVAQMPSNFQPITQPKSDGFWMEEIPSTNPPGRLAFTDQVEGGQHYQAAVVLQRALFPLAPGKLDRHADGGGDRERRFLRAPDPPAPAEVRAARDRGRRAPAKKGSLRVSRLETSAATRSTSRSIAPRWRWATR